MLSPQALQEIDRAIAKYPPEHKRSAVMAALAVAQDEHGWLSPELMRDIADYLEMPAIAVQEVATFYSMYHTAPVGKYTLTLCTNLPCALSGAQSAADHLKCKLGVDFNQTTPNGQFTLKEGECMGACGDAPVLLVNHKRMCSFMHPEKMDLLLDQLSANCSERVLGKEDGAQEPECIEIHEDSKRRPTQCGARAVDLQTTSGELSS